MIKSKKLLIFGMSANSKLARFYFEKDTNYMVVGFIVNKEYIKEDQFCGLPVFAFEEIQTKFPKSDYDIFVAIGYSQMNKVREKIYNELKTMGYELPNYISPLCSFLTEEPIGDNNFILEDNTIQPFVKIGSNNVLWSGNHIGHDGSIGDHNFITSQVVVSGFTKIKNNCFIGVNATIRDSIVIESETLIAAGASIMENTVEQGVYVPPKSVLISKKSSELKIS